MKVCQRQVGQQRTRIGKGQLVLTGKSHHDVRPQTDTWHPPHRPLDKGDKLRPRIVALHARQDAIIAALHWHVQVWTEYRRAGHAVEERIGNSGRFDRADAQACQAGHVFERLHHAQEIVTVAGIRADIDAGEHEFLVTALDQAMRLAHNIVQLAAARSAAREWDDAKGTGKIAAILNFYIGACLVAIIANDVDRKIVTTDLLAMHYTRLPELVWHIDEVSQTHLVFSADDEVEPINALQNFYANLGIATRHHHIGMRRPP